MKTRIGPEVAKLDLTEVRRKLIGEGRKATYVDRPIACYRIFLQRYIDRGSDCPFPSKKADLVWHTHIYLDTRKYERDCQELFGAFLHHVPPPGGTAGGSCSGCAPHG